MKKWLICLSGLWAALTAVAQGTPGATGPLTRPIPAVEHVVVVIVDGLRPDCALLADAPTIRGMIRGGAYSLWARTTAVSITLPSCTSMLTCVNPEKHGVAWNKDQPPAQQGYPAVPTVMELATRAGLVTALVSGKSKFVALTKTGTVTHSFVPPTGKFSDEQVATEAVRIIEEHKPAFLCVHFPDVDSVGHAKGWGTPDQLTQIARTDAQLARVLTALERAGIAGSTAVILSADHGGAGLTHGAEDARSRHIPWLATGAGVRRGYDLTRDRALQINTEDTGATVCWLLGLGQKDYFDGKPITAAFEAAK